MFPDTHDLSGYAQLGQLEPCAICGGQGVETSSERIPIVGLGFVTIGYGYCEGCGHIYQTRRASTGTLNEYYAKYGNYTLNFDHCQTTNRLLSFGHRFTRVYEVGCGTGRHLAAFRNCHGTEVSGCEPSKACCDAAKAKFGIELDNGIESEILPTLSGLECIVYSGVLEHLPDPISSLRRAHKALAPRGHVLIDVPCAKAPDSLPPGWFAFEHLHYYTPDAMVRLLASAGFVATDVRVNYTDFFYPVMTVMARKDIERDIQASTWQIDASKQFIARYKVRDAAFWNATAQKCFGFGRFFVWGGGIHTSKLFHHAPAVMANTVAVIDSDPQKWGKRIGNVPVIGPQQFEGLNTSLPVVISSYAQEQEIARGLTGHKAIMLYH